MQLVAFFSAQEIKAAHAESHRVFNDCKHQLSAWAEMRELRIKTLQVAEDTLAMEERVNRGDCALIEPHAI